MGRGIKRQLSTEKQVLERIELLKQRSLDYQTLANDLSKNCQYMESKTMLHRAAMISDSQIPALVKRLAGLRTMALPGLMIIPGRKSDR